MKGATIAPSSRTPIVTIRLCHVYTLGSRSINGRRILLWQVVEGKEALFSRTVIVTTRSGIQFWNTSGNV